MTLMNLANVRVIDPVLTQLSHGYSQAEFIGSTLFPYVDVPQRAGKVVRFGKEQFAIYDTLRAPGAHTKQIHTVYDTVPFSLIQDRLKGEITVEQVEEAGRIVPQIRMLAAMRPLNAIMLGLENRQATLALTAGNYGTNNKVTLSGTAQWNDAASIPSVNIRTWREAIRSATGKYPNTLVMGPRVFNALAEHPSMIERFKYTSSDSLTTGMISALWGIPNIQIGTAMKLDAAGAMVDIWGKFVVLAYVPPAGARSQYEPSYGYTYRLQGYPIVEREYYDDDHRGWFFPVTLESNPYLTGLEAGFLASAVVA